MTFNGMGKATPDLHAESDRIGERVMRRLDELARHSAEPDALTRLYLTPSHKAAAAQIMAWMREAGMNAEIDAAGNVVGRYPGRSSDAPILLIGSHIDTIRNAGRYDGTLGVIAAIEAVSEIFARGDRLSFAIEVVAFGDEEGVRFPATLAGSRAFAGTFDPATLLIRDAEGVSLAEALRDFGCHADAIPALSRRGQDILGYIELHIEQGPVLEAEDLPVGIVTAIAGASRYRASVTGLAGHAGTVPMALRKDALAAAAEMVLAVERLARDSDALVATVGIIEARPGAPNVIPGEARFSLDIRSPDDIVRRNATARIAAEFLDIATRRGVAVSLVPTYDQAAAICSPTLIRALEASVMRAGIRPLSLASGAGHDGLALASLCPIAMLFVRCRGGISHHPDEAISARDAGAATLVLLDVLRTL